MSLVEKYNVAVPRYTSYPTVPYWNTKKFSVEAWKKSLDKSFDESEWRSVLLLCRRCNAKISESFKQLKDD